MARGVFIHRSDSIYDDRLAEQYQFPAQYLSRAMQCVGDWIVYYEPRKAAGTRGYFAVAKVQQIIPDPAAPGMHLAIIAPGTYLDFSNPVPFSTADGLVERGLLNPKGRISGRAQSAVRPLSNADFNRIVTLGLEDASTELPRADLSPVPMQFSEQQQPFGFEEERERSATLVSRAIRDRAFRTVVLRAYGSQCAISGLKLINGGGRAEVEAAHIRPVEHNGPDIVSNGLALSGTMHWMFDRGLIGVSDSSEIIISRHVNDPGSVAKMINPTGRLLPPERPFQRPHPDFLQWHR
ncbi:MAG: HNH endonuclease, partial [Proteobacteria bacterium]|nr:HNH endonuclease [Pseudomonadota bacterium]